MCQTSQREEMRDHCLKTASRRTFVDDDEKTAIDHDVEQNGSERDQEGKGRINNDDVIS